MLHNSSHGRNRGSVTGHGLMAVTIINGPRRRRQTRQRVARTHTGTHTHRDWHTHAHLLPRGMRAAAKQPLQIIPSYCTLLHLLRRIAVCRRPCSCIYSFGPRRRSAGPTSDALSRRVTVLSRRVTVLSRRVTAGHGPVTAGHGPVATGHDRLHGVQSTTRRCAAASAATVSTHPTCAAATTSAIRRNKAQ